MAAQQKNSAMHSINPGLLFYRYYYGDVDAALLGFRAWKNGVERQSKGNASKHIGEYDGQISAAWLNNVPTAKEKEARAHYNLRNQALFSFEPDTVALAQQQRQYSPPEAVAFNMKTTYPGLLIGLGYNHQLSAKEAINGGFYFDHTTGLPFLPGSSIKGIIRATLEERAPVEPKDLPDFLARIFGPNELAAHKQIIFHDALLQAVPKKETYPLFGPDSVTPHLNRDSDSDLPDRYVEPTPLSFLKIMPGVTFTFLFDIPAEVQINERLKYSRVELLELFKQAIDSKGVGAKTRLGYGRFETADPEIQWGGEASFRDESLEKWSAEALTNAEELLARSADKRTSSAAFDHTGYDPLANLEKQAKQRQRVESKSLEGQAARVKYTQSHKGKFYFEVISPQRDHVTLKRSEIPQGFIPEAGKIYNAIITNYDQRKKKILKVRIDLS